MAGTVGAFASRLATSFVALDEGTTQDRLERGQLAQESVAALSQCGSGLVLHFYQTTYITGLIVIEVNTYFNLFVWVWSVASSSEANSKSDWASSRRGGKPSESDSDGSAQSVHSRATLKLPRSNSRRISVSTPAMRRFLSTSKRRPRSGWKGCRISAHPKGELRSSAVRSDRPDDSGPGGARGR